MSWAMRGSPRLDIWVPRPPAVPRERMAGHSTCHTGAGSCLLGSQFLFTPCSAKQALRTPQASCPSPSIFCPRPPPSLPGHWGHLTPCGWSSLRQEAWQTPQQSRRGIWAWGQGCFLTHDTTWVLPWGVTLRPLRTAWSHTGLQGLHPVAPVVCLGLVAWGTCLSFPLTLLLILPVGPDRARGHLDLVSKSQVHKGQPSGERAGVTVTGHCAECLEVTGLKTFFKGNFIQIST